MLAQLPFDERTTAALLHGHEPEGRLLRAIVAHERGEALPEEFPPRRVARSLPGGDELERLARRCPLALER